MLLSPDEHPKAWSQQKTFVHAFITNQCHKTAELGFEALLTKRD